MTTRFFEEDSNEICMAKSDPGWDESTDSKTSLRNRLQAAIGCSKEIKGNAKSSEIYTGCPSTGKDKEKSRECGSHLLVLGPYRKPESTSNRGWVAGGVVDVDVRR